MIVRWPVPKRLALKAIIEEKWMTTSCQVLPRDIAVLLGTIPNAAFVAPLGNHLSIRLQQCLNAAIACAGRKVSCRWWFQQQVTVPDAVLEDVATIHRSLDDNVNNPVWQSYIGFLVDREPTARIISDAAHKGLGGWSPDFLFKWRLSKTDLIRMGFDLSPSDPCTLDLDNDENCLHINILEFVAIIINLWLVIVVSRRRTEPEGGHIFAIFADNTSALSWLHYASRSHRPAVCCLAQFTSALLFASGFQGKVQGCHLAGKLNRGADALSRCQQFPTWASAMAQCSPLLQCTTYYRLPHELLLLLGSMSSNKPSVEVSGALMARCLSLVPATLRVGSSETAIQLRVYPSHPGRADAHTSGTISTCCCQRRHHQIWAHLFQRSSCR
jgi:hypothetical protein